AVDPAKALRRRRITSVVALLGVPLVGLGVYGMHGVPGLPSLPLSARLSTNPANLDVNVAVARIEAHLALNPTDGRGWDVVAPVYFRLQRYDDAAKAYRAAIQYAGPSQERFAGLGDALTQAAQGMVTAQAREAFQQAVTIDATDAKSRFYLAIALEQEGKNAEAAQAYKALIADAPPAANWMPMVQERLARIEQPVPAGGEAIAALPAPEQAAMIRSMVESLSSRLGTTGGTLEEWSRLVQARSVLGERELAVSALDAARRQLAADPIAVTTLGELARRLGLPEKTP
ncbi:MAG: tetratricopeptide repeat protein, partial [Bosea sp. (in: a-proteobacteria)]